MRLVTLHSGLCGIAHVLNAFRLILCAIRMVSNLLIRVLVLDDRNHELFTFFMRWPSKRHIAAWDVVLKVARLEMIASQMLMDIWAFSRDVDLMTWDIIQRIFRDANNPSCTEYNEIQAVFMPLILYMKL